MSAVVDPCVAGITAAYPALVSRLPGARVPWLRKLRQDAAERFAALGLPTTRDEDWKYTSVTAIARRSFELGPSSGLPAAVEALVARHALDDAHLVVFADGAHVPGLSRVARLPEGVRVGSLADAVERGREFPEGFFGADEDEDDGFTAMNLALWADGACIEFARGASLDAPLHLLFISSRPGRAGLVRNLVRVGSGAQATVIEHHVGAEGGDYLSNVATRILLERDARLSHVRLQQEGGASFHIGSVATAQQRDSLFSSHAFAFGARLSRARIATRLEAEGCDARLSGLYVGRGRQHMDHHTCIDHREPRGASRELYKGVLDDAARAVFNGRVIVRPGAQRTDALQSNRNLLLSPQAEVDTKPQLEIWADDVKCAHGATVGQLDADQLYYLRSRGVAADEAQALLVRAFAADALAGIEHAPLRSRLEALLPGAMPAVT